jgi:Transcriptional regulator, AbiEi antitoxin
MHHQSGKADGVIGRIASRSHGVVTRAELLDAGVTADQIRQRLKRGSLLVAHPGIYRVGHEAPSVEARYAAAVKACGPRALLCGFAAAHLWGLTKGAPPLPSVVAVGCPGLWSACDQKAGQLGT